MDTHIKNSGFCKLLVIFIFLYTVSITSQEIIKPKIQPGNQTNIIQQPDEPIDPGDGGPSIKYFRDFDRDGYGDPAVTRYSSTGIPPGYVINDKDCDDRNAALTYPQVIGYRDADKDGYGDASKSALFCYELEIYGALNYVFNSDDCNDSNSTINPATVWYLDADNDGFAVSTKTQCTSPGTSYSTTVKPLTDCNDSNAGINPNTKWYLDADNDGYASTIKTQCTSPGTGYSRTVKPTGDCNDSNASINPNTKWYLDADNDGFASTIKTQCTSPGAGYSTTVKPTGDCNDSSASINPNTKWYLDADNDGFASTIKTQCTNPGTGYSTTVKPTGDCNDSNASINPNTKWYLDADNDGFAISTKTQCASPGTGYSTTVKPLTDCNDSNASINPNTVWYKDSDGDGFAASTVTQCTSPGTGYGTASKPMGDCNDSNASINPNTVWYKDSDGDGFAASTVTQCTSPGSGYGNASKPMGDCNDSNAAINPNTKWYADTDGDGFGDPNSSLTQCTQPSGYVSNNTDQCPTVNGPNNGCVDTPYQAANFSNENYIYTRSFQKPMGSISEIKFNKDVIEGITYFDGLGRPKQNIGIKQSPDGTDIVTHIGYDEFGRQTKEYLPYQATGAPASYRTNAESATNSYYVANYAAELDALTPNPFSETDFEPSPLNRVLKQAAPGEDWKLGSGHEIEFDYKTNVAGDEVRLFTVNLTATYVPTLVSSGTSYYTAGELYKTITRDENHAGNSKNHTTEEFKDKEGRVVLKRTFADVDLNNNGSIGSGETEIAHDTYYVYDRFGNLTYVIPPKVNTADGVSATELNELCYQYRYDSRNRLIEKKIPGKGSSGDWEEIVYNKLDQPILTRDPKLKAEQKWLFTKYDAFGRVAYTGLIDNTHSRTSLQTAADDTSRYEQIVQRTASPSTYGGTPVYYNNEAMPQVMTEIHTINYYDNYTFDLAGLSIPTGNVYNQTIATNVKGLPTGSKVRVLGANHWITTLMVYDEKGRTIYGASKNEYLGTTDIVETLYDFGGKVLESKTTHTKGSNTPIVTIDAFTYDHVGRLLKQTQRINGGTPELIAENNYDNLGQLKSKGVGNVATSTSRLQTVDYTYNIRGWLKQINNPTTMGTDLFAFKIGYNEGSNPLYNGNIALTQWKTKSINPNPPNNPVSSQYTYTYDALNRLLSATDNTGNYNVSGIVYDKNGNIKNLTRKGLSNPASIFGNMDVLTYGYDNTNIGNKLIKVEDSSGSTEGFKNGSNTAVEYEYDANGNMMSDNNKGITAITYNHLNLPVQVTFASGNIQYIYSANGTKLKKAVSTGTETLYAGNYIYEGTTGNAQLQFFNHPEGYVMPKDINDYSAGFDYVYNYVDHLGNIRLSYKNIGTAGSPNLEILEENNYYPFGLKHKGYNDGVSAFANSVAGKFKYNGIELEEALGLNLYEMELRQYDPAIARWTGIDPVTHHSMSTYTAFDNNPVYWADPSGADSIYNFETGQYVINGQVVSQDEAIAYANNGGNADGSNNNTPTNQGDPKVYIHTYDNSLKDQDRLSLVDISGDQETISFLMGFYPYNSMTDGEIRAEGINTLITIFTAGISTAKPGNLRLTKAADLLDNNSTGMSSLSFEILPMAREKNDLNAQMELFNFENARDQGVLSFAEYAHQNNLVIIFSENNLFQGTNYNESSNIGTYDYYKDIILRREENKHINYMYLGINSGNGIINIINKTKLK